MKIKVGIPDEDVCYYHVFTGDECRFYKHKIDIGDTPERDWCQLFSCIVTSFQKCPDCLSASAEQKKMKHG